MQVTDGELLARALMTPATNIEQLIGVIALNAVRAHYGELPSVPPTKHPTTWLNRAQTELDELERRYNWLNDFLNRRPLPELGIDDHLDLLNQRRAMRDYLDALERRVKRHLPLVPQG